MVTHANRGRFFERYLQHLHMRYREEGRARIEFVPTPTRARRSRDGISWEPVRKGIVDYVGLLARGRFVAFDAKTTRNESGWRVKVSQRSPRNDTTHQWEFLNEAHALGGLAFYLIYAETLDRVFLALMPFPVEERQCFTHLTEVVRDKNGWWDWLSALEEGGVVLSGCTMHPQAV